MHEESLRRQLRTWITEHSKVPAKGLTDSTPILEKGLLSSLDIVEFVLFIESLRGDEVDVDEIDPVSFTSIDTLYSTFFAR